jgi:hypothetical protein
MIVDAGIARAYPCSSAVGPVPVRALVTKGVSEMTIDTVELSLELADAPPLDEKSHKRVASRLEWARQTLASVFPKATKDEMRLAAAAERLGGEICRFELEVGDCYGASSPFLCAVIVDSVGAQFVLEAGLADEIAGWAKAAMRS